MAQADIALMAHLMRRAGFGATRDELEAYAARGYEQTVEELLRPEEAPEALEDEDLIRRYHMDQNILLNLRSSQAYWVYRMVNTKRPLYEKMGLFWHHVFATGAAKIDYVKAILWQVDTFRRYGMGSFRDLLVRVSRDPSMIFWLDNQENHRDAVNENYGRELLELFSMGVGNYTEEDVREVSRAFTGWTVRDAPYYAARFTRGSVWPYGSLGWQFEYRDDDHDHGEKTFLGERGRFNGEDVIDIICRQPATARFIARHLYNFFVADEAQVPAWGTVPPGDPEAIDTLAEVFVASRYEVRPVLRFLFNSDFFKDSAFRRVKSPAEFVAGAARLAGGYLLPDVEDRELALEPGFMGQDLFDPPSVEGWHTGRESVNTADLVNRVNFSVMLFSDHARPGVRSIVDGVREMGPVVPPEVLVDSCADLLGPLRLSADRRQQLVEHASASGDLRFGTAEQDSDSAGRITEMLTLMVSSREYQFG